MADLLHEKQVFISVITELELLSFKGISRTEKDIIADFVKHCFVVDLNQAIKDLSVNLRTAYSLKLPDAIIASTAAYLNIPLITADSSFRKVKEIDLVLYKPL